MPATAAAPKSESEGQRLAALREQVLSQQALLDQLRDTVADLVGAQSRPDRFVQPALAREVAVGIHRSTTGAVAVALQTLEVLALERRAALREGDLALVQRLDLRAASLGCATLDQAIDELELPADLDEIMPTNVDAFLRRDAGGVIDTPSAGSQTMDLDTFISWEIALLELAGLSHDLAYKHLASSFGYYRNAGEREAPTTVSLVKELIDARDIVCARLEELIDSKRTSERDVVRKNRLKLVRSVVGGILVVAANTAATTFLFPPGVAASVALGSGAVGQIAGLLA